MSVDHDTEAATAARRPDTRMPARDAPLVPGVDPAAVLARVAHDRADPGLVIGVAQAAGNRYVQGVAKRQLARSAADEVGTYVDPMTDPRYSRIRPLLQRTYWGRAALAVMTGYGVKTFFATEGPPANYAQKLDRVKLNMALRDDVVSAYYVHEMYHASQFHEGKSPGPSSHDDKGKWVRILVDEEIEGTALGYLHKLQLERTEPRVTADDKPPHMSFFRNAFDAGYRDAIKAGKDVETARAEGRARGRRMAEYLIRPTGGDRHRLGAGDWMSYTEYYAAEWEGAQKAEAAKEPAPASP